MRRNTMSEFKMRKLKTGDIYKMSRILKKMDIELTVEEGVSQTQMGIQMVQRILENLHQAEKEVNEFLAELIGITAEEFNELSLGEVVDVFNQFKNQEDIGAFLKLAAK